MKQFSSLVVSGLSIGFVYALIAVGFVTIFKTTRVVNFSHAVIAVLGAFVVAKTHREFGFGVALILGIGAAVAANVLIEFVVLRRARRPEPALLAIITLGLAIAIGAELRRQIGPNVYQVGDPWGKAVFRFGSSAIPQTRIAAAIVAIAVIALVYVAIRKTGWGISVRATSEDREAAALMGIRLGRVSASVWALAGALAAIAGVFFTTFPGAGVSGLTEVVILGAFPAAIIGGLDSPPGAVAGGLLVGLATTLAAGYQEHIAFLGRGAAEVIPFALMLIVLLARPSGLFGSNELTRV